MLVSPEQIRAARALLRLDQQELAARAGLSVVTLRRLETPEGAVRVTPASVESVRRVLEQAGAEFIADGVRRRGPEPKRNPEELARQLRALAERSAALFRDLPAFSENDLYDENGLPK